MERYYPKTARDIRAIEARMRENRRKKQLRVKREKRAIAKADEEYERLARALCEAKAHAHRDLLPDRRDLNLKNFDVMRIWTAIQNAFTSQFAREGLANNQLYEAMRVAVPNIPESTMRSHLHRLKGKRALTKIGAYWFLEAPVRDRAQIDPISAEPASPTSNEGLLQ